MGTEEAHCHGWVFFVGPHYSAGEISMLPGTRLLVPHTEQYS
jgi:hypothetical protein